MDKELKNRIEADTAQVFELLSGTSRNEMTNCRLESGMDYLVERYGYKAAKEIWKKPHFWQWWIRTWWINDIQIIDHCRQHNVVPTLEAYIKSQNAKMKMLDYLASNK